MKIRQTVLTVSLCLNLAAFSFAGDNQKSVVEKSHARAVVVLDAGIAAMGGNDAINDVQTITLNTEAELYPRMQMPSAEPPHKPGHMWEKLHFDVAGNRAVAEVKLHGNAGFSGNNRTVITGNEGYNFDLVAKTLTPIPVTGTQSQLQQFYRRLPNLLLQTAQQRNMSLRYIGEDTFDGRKHNVISFVHNDGQQVALYFDAKTNMLSKYELIYPDALEGDDAAEIIFNGYTDVAGLKVPAGWTWKQAGEVVGRFKYDVKFNEKFDDKLFETSDAGFTKVAFAQPGQVATEKLADGVYLVQNLGGGNYNVMAIDAGDYIVAFEAPISTLTTEQAIREIKKAIPNKPIKYAVVTHHHSDHMGGLRAYVAEGATVITTKGNKKLIEYMVSLKHPDALTRSGRKLSIETFEKKRVLELGKRTVELRDIGPNPHANEMVVAYLPSDGILYQGDLFFMPFNDAPVPPAQESTTDFYSKLKQTGWSVNKLVGVHGRVTTVSELAKSVESAAGTVAASN
jgi:glyoxylase-like metal-dependent hydrolase (beta-lactamase superfamily II)